MMTHDKKILTSFFCFVCRRRPWPSSQSGGPTGSRSGGSSCAPAIRKLSRFREESANGFVNGLMEILQKIMYFMRLLAGCINFRAWTVLPVSSVTPSMTTTISNCELSSDCGVISKNGLSSSICGEQIKEVSVMWEEKYTLDT